MLEITNLQKKVENRIHRFCNVTSIHAVL